MGPAANRPKIFSIVTKKILLVDDHEIVRSGVRALLSDDWEVCGEAADGEQAVEKAIALKPDLILMDLSMPNMNGIEATRKLRQLGLTTRIVILSMHEGAGFVLGAKHAGADACLSKTCGPRQLHEVIVQLLKDIPERGVEIISP